MPVDYNRMKVSELRDALTARGLPTNGLKGELISRLTASDETASPAIASTEKRSTPATTATTAITTITPTTAAAAHLPSADEDYEVDWEHDDKPAEVAPAIATTTASAPAATPTVAPAAVAPAETSAAASPTRTDAKPKRKTIASLFENTSALLTKSGNEPSSPSTVTDETSSAAPAPTSAVAAATPAFSANLPTTSLDEEIARRKKRAERFGLNAEESETLKSLERQKRFGIVREKKQIKGLDEALPIERERKRRGELQPQQPQGRAGKRGRFENAASLQQQQQQQQQQQRDGTRRGGRGKGNGAVESGRVQKPVQTSGLSAEDKKRAEERRKRFAA